MTDRRSPMARIVCEEMMLDLNSSHDSDLNSDLDRQSLRGFLARLESELPDEMLRIREPVQTKLEMTSLVFELERLGKSPVVVFENVAGHTMPVVTNVAGNRRVLALALGVTPAELPTAFRERCTRYIPVEPINRPAWHDVTIEGDDIDLAKFPVPLHFAIDAAPYITAGQITARDPETGIDTTGFHRLMLKDRNRLGVSLHSRRRMWEFHRRAAARGQNLPAAITLGIHPLHYMGSMVYAYPQHVRKFEIIGGLFGEPYRVARCGTADIEVPAGAEIVIEGEILADEHEPEGPFGEFTGYASFRSTENVFVAKRIRMRAEALFHSVVSGMSQDHILVSCITREGEILNALRRNLPNVKAVHVPHTTCGAFMAFISMKKTSAGEPQQAIMATLGTEFYTKYVIVVDEDVDVFSLSDVMWAVATRVRAEKDIIFIPGAKGAILDPTSDPADFTLTKMGIDATKPLGRDFAARLTISDEQRARARELLAKAGLVL
jgi:2,5-furandicarboxylate decarboxylase 1